MVANCYNNLFLYIPYIKIDRSSHIFILKASDLKRNFLNEIVRVGLGKVQSIPSRRVINVHSHGEALVLFVKLSESLFRNDVEWQVFDVQTIQIRSSR